MIDYTIIQRPGALGRLSAEDGLIRVDCGKESYFLRGERIHGEALTINVRCSSGKDAYPTYAAAEKALRMKSIRGRKTKRIYKCRECGCFHFTTNDGKARKARPYNREHEKKYARFLTLPFDGQSSSVDATGFSMKRFQNFQNNYYHLNYAS